MLLDGAVLYERRTYERPGSTVAARGRAPRARHAPVDGRAAQGGAQRLAGLHRLARGRAAVGGALLGRTRTGATLGRGQGRGRARLHPGRGQPRGGAGEGGGTLAGHLPRRAGRADPGRGRRSPAAGGRWVRCLRRPRGTSSRRTWRCATGASPPRWARAARPGTSRSRWSGTPANVGRAPGARPPRGQRPAGGSGGGARREGTCGTLAGGHSGARARGPHRDGPGRGRAGRHPRPAEPGADSRALRGARSSGTTSPGAGTRWPPPMGCSMRWPPAPASSSGG